jgi:hypothetical protein
MIFSTFLLVDGAGAGAGSVQIITNPDPEGPKSSRIRNTVDKANTHGVTVRKIQVSAVNDCCVVIECISFEIF